MSDLAVINIEVVYDNTPMDKMIRSTTAAEAMVKRLNQAYKDGKITMDDAMRGLQEIEVYEKRNSVAMQDNIRLEKESARVAKENAIIKAQAIKDLSNKADTAFALTMQRLKEEAAAEQALLIATKQEVLEKERLAQKFNSLYASSKLYETTLNELNRATALGVISDKQRELSLEKLNAQMASGTGIFATYARQTGSGANRMGVAFQQTGYQVSDFIVQIQSGTNPLVAFSQQATQMAGLLYLLPPALTAARLSFVYFSISVSAAMAAVTILIPLVSMLVMTFVNSSKASEDTSKSIDKQTQAYDSLIGKIEELRLARQMEASGTLTKEEQTLQNTLNTLLTQRIDLQDRLNKLKDIGSRATAFSEERQAQIDLLQAEVDKNTEALKAINYQRTLSAAANRRANERRDAYREEKKLADEQALAQQVAADKATFLKNIFHAMAGEAGAVSVELDGWAGKLIDAANASTGLQDFLLKQRMDTGMRGRGLPADTYSMDTAPIDTGKLFGNIEFGSTGAAIKPEDKKKTGTGGATKKDPLVELQKQITLQEELNGKTEAEVKVRQALGEDFSKYSPMVIKGLEDQIQKQIELEERLKEQQQVFDVVKNSMEDAFMGMIDGTKSAKDAFKSMAAAIIKELYNVLVVQQMVGSFNASTGAGSGIVGAIASGLSGAFGGGSGYVKGMAGRANGGPISAGVPYMVGERGPELIIPKSSGTVLTNGQTKAALGGSSNESYVVNNNISVTGSDSAMVRQEIAKMIPQISSATKAAMIDAKRRGGQMASAFR